ncbi:MAG: transcriptional regulator, AraC family [Proteobacteria bacterium]|nr:transcriptional regulator, AraC family [Pseudomonadota bacterium]
MRLIRARAINADFRHHSHRSILVGVVLSGQRRLLFADGQLHVLPGNGFLLPADLPHRCAIDEAHSYRVVSILPSLWQAFAAAPQQAQILRAGSPALLAARRLVAGLRSDHQALAIESRLVALQQALLSGDERIDDAPLAPERLLKIRDWLDAHCTEAVRLTTLAQIAECSPGLINRLFRQHFGLPPYEYLVQLRLGLAARRLRESEQSLADIAYETGFADQSHLQRFFRRAYGTTPQAYRQASARSADFSPAPE